MTEQQQAAMRQALEAWQTSVYGSESHHKAMLLAMTNMAQALEQQPADEPVLKPRTGGCTLCGYCAATGERIKAVRHEQPTDHIVNANKMVEQQPAVNKAHGVRFDSAIHEHLQQPSDEPVAFRDKDGNIVMTIDASEPIGHVYSIHGERIKSAAIDSRVPNGTPLYIRPQPSDHIPDATKMVEQRPVDSVPMPTTVEQAKAMALIGHAWLRDNAPQELKQPTGELVAWKPIATAPRYGRILVACPEIGICVASAGWDNETPDQIRWEVVNGIAVTATHWMPIPTRPQPADKPVAIHQYRVPLCSDWYDGIPDHHDGHGPYEVRTLYTRPQPAAQWVGLTLEDKREYIAQDYGGSRLDAMDWADKRLREKNGDRK